MLVSYEYVSAWMRSRCRTERGASLIEYALLAGLIAVVCLLAVTFLGQKTSTKYSAMGSGLK